MRKVFLPFLIIFCFILESLFVELMPAKMYESTKIFVPHFLMVMIIFVTIFGSRKHGIMYGFIFGLLFDVVYTEIIGIYLFMIPLVAYLTAGIMKILQSNLIVVSFVTLMGVGLLELGVYGMNILIDRTNMSFISFMELRFWPTLLVNLIFMIIFAFPLKKYLDHFAEALRND